MKTKTRKERIAITSTVVLSLLAVCLVVVAAAPSQAQAAPPLAPHSLGSGYWAGPGITFNITNGSAADSNSDVPDAGQVPHYANLVGYLVTGTFTVTSGGQFLVYGVNGNGGTDRTFQGVGTYNFNDCVRADNNGYDDTTLCDGEGRDVVDVDASHINQIRADGEIYFWGFGTNGSFSGTVWPVYEDSDITRTPTGTATPTLDPNIDTTDYGLVNGSFEQITLAPWEALDGQLISADAGQQPVSGPASCGSNYFEFQPHFYRDTIFEPQSGFSGPGTDTPTPQLVLREVWRESPALEQRFYWPGGTLYFQASVRKPTSAQYPQIGVEIIQVTTGYDVPATMRDFWQPGGGLNTSLDWQTITVASSFPLPPGYYDFKLSTGYEWREYPVFVSDDPNRDTSQAYRFYIDDINVSTGTYNSLCVNGATLTPTGTRTNTPTPTRTPTGTRTTTNTPTPTAGPVSSWSNCAFETGSNGWSGSNFSIQLAGGPIGPSYAQVNNGGVLRQSFTWTGGTAYFSYWVGPGSYGSVRVRNLSTALSQTLSVSANPASWARFDRVLTSLATGSYVFEVVPNATPGFKIDGVMVAKNAYQYCGQAVSGTPITPTTGPTSFITATSTNTLQFTRTASATITVTPSRTNFPTNTPAASYTPRPTNTQIATATHLSEEKTATAQGTTIPTYTPYPTYTPFPTTTPYATPPQQPNPGPFADCIQPQSGDIPGWMAYQQCQALSFFSWSPTNTAQLAYWPTLAAGREPFGTINETSDFVSDLSGLVSNTDWSSGAGCSSEPPDPSKVLAAAQGLLSTGQIDFVSNNYVFVDSCDLLAGPIVGPYITRAICILLNLLCVLGLLQWFQWMSNAIVIITFAAYIKKSWIDKALS